MDVNMELYKVFYHVAKVGSISLAAKELFVSQPAVSQSIKRLEDKLGGRVFIRTPRGMKLTQEGEILYRHFEQAYKIMQNAETRFWETMNLIGGTIRIGASDTLCKHYLLPKLNQFHQEYPEVRIQVTNGTTPETLKLLRTGEVDLGIVNLPIQEDNQFEVREVLKVQDCFVVGPKFNELLGKTISLAELEQYPIMLLEKGSNSRKYIDDYCRSKGVILKPEFELGSIDVLVQFALIGLGVAFVVKDFIQQELSLGSLHEVILREQVPGHQIGMVTMRNVPLAVSAKKFTDLLRN